MDNTVILLITLRQWRLNSVDMRMLCEDANIVKKVCSDIGGTFAYQKFTHTMGLSYCTINKDKSNKCNIRQIATDFVVDKIITNAKAYGFLPRIVIEHDVNGTVYEIDKVKPYLIPKSQQITVRPRDEGDTTADKLPF